MIVVKRKRGTPIFWNVTSSSVVNLHFNFFFAIHIQPYSIITIQTFILKQTYTKLQLNTRWMECNGMEHTIQQHMPICQWENCQLVVKGLECAEVFLCSNNRNEHVWRHHHRINSHSHSHTQTANKWGKKCTLYWKRCCKVSKLTTTAEYEHEHEYE